jgi:hypothetical protein
MRMAKALTKLGRILNRLEKHYGQPAPLRITDPLEIILFDNVVYLADDQKRATAFAALKKRVGLQPDKLLAAPQETLVEIAGMGGIVPKISAQSAQEISGRGRSGRRETSAVYSHRTGVRDGFQCLARRGPAWLQRGNEELFGQLSRGATFARGPDSREL